ncbi:MAG: Gfo/Idh/MocA family oxidoreductase [Planctomycetes bacterium]|nr:Gfo/Idh/MocA family oxidoreductase [Planctomycetota bacterium]
MNLRTDNRKVDKIRCNDSHQKQIGIAFIGLGAMGFSAAHKALNLPQVKLVLGCDVREDRRRRAVQELNILVENDWRKLVYRDDIDLIYVATPNDQHVEVACEAMKAGKYLLLQKPMAHDIKACHLIMETQRQTNAFLQIGFECRYSLLYKHAKEIINSGNVGDIRNFHMDYFVSLWDVWLEHPDGWKWLAERSGGMVGEKLSHYIDLFQWYTDSLVEEVDVFTTMPVLPYFTVSDSLHLGMRSDSGAVGMITFSFCRASSAKEDQISNVKGYGQGSFSAQTLIGERGSLYLHDDYLLDLFMYKRDGKIGPHLVCRKDYSGQCWEDMVHNTRTELEDVVRRVACGEPPSVSPEVSYQVFEVCFAAEESIRLRQPVRLAKWRKKTLL